MKKINLTVIILFFVVLISGCEKDIICKKGSGGIVTETIEIPNFSGIDVSVDAEVIINQGSTQVVIVEGDANVIESIGKNVNNDLWEIDFLEKCFKNYELKITITTSNLDEVNISGSGEVLVNDFSNVASFNSDISGSGSIMLNKLTSCQNLNLEISGSGTCSALDSTNILHSNIDISGSGMVDLFMFEVENCTADISGSGNAKVFVNSTLDADISGSGKVSYKGFPTISIDISGSGSIVDAN